MTAEYASTVAPVTAGAVESALTGFLAEKTNTLVEPGQDLFASVPFRRWHVLLSASAQALIRRVVAERQGHIAIVRAFIGKLAGNRA